MVGRSGPGGAVRAQAASPQQPVRGIEDQAIADLSGKAAEQGPPGEATGEHLQGEREGVAERLGVQ